MMTPDALPPDAQATAPVSLLAGRYQLLDKLGQGGMGAVFHARDAQLDRHVAVKLLPTDSIHDADAVARFHREARALARLSHPGIIQAFDHGADGDRHFLVMEFVEGHSLAGVLREQGRLAPARAADFVYQAALALHHAHKSGLVHRDVKPSNLLLSSDGRLRLLDLGLARFFQDQIGDAGLTREGAGLGTPDYCPPEQFRDARSADPRADVYSLGCTLYHLIAGRVPFPGSSFSEKARAHETQEPTPLEELCPEVPAGLALTVRRMMAKRPADRFQSMAEVAEALMPHVAGSSAAFPQIRKSATWDGSRLSTMTAMPRRRVGLLTAAVAFAAVLLVTGGVLAVGFASGWFHPSESPIAQRGDSGSTEKEKSPPTPADTGRAQQPEAPAKLPDNPNVLTVSQEEKDGGKYRTITEALAAVQTGQTVRILDDAIYHEALSIRGPAMAGITLEAVRGAALEVNTPGVRPVDVMNVPQVTLRGFRLRTTRPGRGVLVVVRGDCPDLCLERLELSAAGDKGMNGIEYYAGRDRSAGPAPVLIRACTFRQLGIAVGLNGEAIYAVSGAAVRDNRFEDCALGVKIAGGAAGVQVVGNRFSGMLMAATQLEALSPEAEDVLIANNSFSECIAAFRVWDTAIKGKGVRVENNLLLGNQNPDMLFLEADRTTPPKLGDGAAVAKAHSFSHNWREGRAAGTLREAIPPDPKKGDLFHDKLTGLNRDPKSPDYLRPDPQSKLATAGAGNEDPSLPRYIGALPPDGTDAWDWDRAGRMPKGAQLLTVSKDSNDGGAFRSIREALKKVEKPWATIRVLDAETYEETIDLTDRKKHEGLTLEAVGGATLLMGKNISRLIVVQDVPRVRITGFKLTDREDAKDVNRTFVVISGNVPGVALTHLEMAPKSPLRSVVIQNAVAESREPLRVEKCAIRPACRMSNDGIGITGNLDSEPATNICVRDNRIMACLRGINARGALRNVHITGNLVARCKDTGLQVEDVGPTSRGLLIANNTAFGCGSAFRVWDHAPYKDRLPGQVEIANDLFFQATACDVAYILDPGKSGFQSPGDSEALLKAWRFGHNCRDFSGPSSAFALLAAPEDVRFKHDDLLSTSDNELDRVRPAKDSPLATQGAGTKDSSLPLYIGALPREGDSPWDWDRTWRARVKKTEDKK